MGLLDSLFGKKKQNETKLLTHNDKVGAARAFIRGGWQRGGGDEGFYGIELELSPVETLLKSRKITALR